MNPDASQADSVHVSPRVEKLARCSRLCYAGPIRDGLKGGKTPRTDAEAEARRPDRYSRGNFTGRRPHSDVKMPGTAAVVFFFMIIYITDTKVGLFFAIKGGL